LTITLDSCSLLARRLRVWGEIVIKSIAALLRRAALLLALCLATHPALAQISTVASPYDATLTSTVRDGAFPTECNNLAKGNCTSVNVESISIVLATGSARGEPSSYLRTAHFAHAKRALRLQPMVLDESGQGYLAYTDSASAASNLQRSVQIRRLTGSDEINLDGFNVRPAPRAVFDGQTASD
jgi:hypothetical protein